MDFLKEVKASLLIMAGFYIVIGLFMLFAPIFVSNVICYILGALCLILAGFAINLYIGSEVKGIIANITLIVAIILIALGVFVVMTPDAFISFIPIIVGAVLIVDSVNKFQTMLKMRSNGYEKWWQVLVLGVFILAFGLLIMFNPFATAIAFIRFVGALLILNGLTNIFTAISYSKIKNLSL